MRYKCNSALETCNDGLGFLATKLEPFCGPQTGRLGIGLLLEELVDFCHNAKGHQILAVELQGLKKVAPRVRLMWSSTLTTVEFPKMWSWVLGS